MGMWKERMPLCFVLGRSISSNNLQEGALTPSFKIPKGDTGQWEKFHFWEAIPPIHSNMDTRYVHKATYYHSNLYSRTLANTQASINGGLVK